jgi:hypothetical protein
MSTVKTTTLSTLDGTYTVPAETLARGACRAWCNFNGTGTVAIRASFNVSSITDNGTGDYTVNFTTAMVDADYSAIATGDSNEFAGNNVVVGARDLAASSVRIIVHFGGSGFIDRQDNFVAIFR